MYEFNWNKKLQEEYTKDIIAWRRHLHQYPEISFEEQETTKYLAGELDKLGIPYVINPEKTPALWHGLKVLKG